MELDYAKISEALYALLTLVLIPLAGFAARWLNAKYQTERAGMSDKARWALDNGVQIAIFAAEQLYGAGKGEDKKAYALAIAEKWLAQYNITIDLDVLEAAIEAAVKQSFDKPALAQGES